MGRVYTFTCPRCSYQARVSGGREEGYHCVTQTIVCRDCRRLHDVPVRLRVAEAATPGAARPGRFPAPEDSLPPMLLFGSPPRTQWLTLPLRCPVAAAHRVEPWATAGKCPRCATPLEREVLPYRIWD